MLPYEDKSGNSGVSAYKIAPHSITIRFKEGPTYLYTDARPGKAKVEKMKRLAGSGQGLSTYISKYVKDNYAAKLE